MGSVLWPACLVPAFQQPGCWHKGPHFSPIIIVTRSPWQRVGAPRSTAQARATANHESRRGRVHAHTKEKMASIFKSVFGPGTTQETKPTGTETIQKLCSRVTSSTALDDRRDALRAIKGMSRQYRREVGDLCLELIFEAIKNDRSDSETVGYAVESLLNVLSSDEGEQKVDDLEIGQTYSDKIVQSHDNIALLLSLVEEFDFQVRRATTRLLTALLQYKLFEVQEAILSSPMGISKIMDLLSDNREVIRNEALLLLVQLTLSNSQIQKIVAFESAFERLMSIIDEEGLSDGSIIVQDCIIIMRNLLRGNPSNQAFYREASQIQSVVPFFDLKLSSNSKWSEQKISNVSLMLNFVRTLVSPLNSQQNISACQKIMHQCRLLNLLCTFMFAAGVPTEVLVESINTVSEVIRGNFVNQQFFDTVLTPSQPPRSGILTILMCMVNEKQPLPLRLATLYCFQSYLYKNEVGQQKVIETLLPSSTESTISAGQVLCTGIFGSDPLSNWMTAVGLASALNSSLKPQLLRVQLSMQGKGQVTLLQQCSDILVNSPDLKPTSKVGLLLLLITWLHDCPTAVNLYLANSVNVPYLTGMIESHYNSEIDKVIGGLCATLIGICLAYNDGSSSGFTPETLRQIITRRINQDSFIQSLNHISSSDFFIQSSKQPQLLANTVNQICFDYSFTILFRQVSDVILKSLDPNFVSANSSLSVSQTYLSPSRNNASFEEHDSVVQQFKNLLHEQDGQILALKAKNEELEKLLAKERIEFQQKLSAASTTSNNGGDDIEGLKQANISHQRIQESLRQELATKNALLEKMKQDSEALQNKFDTAIQSNDIAQLKEERDQLRSENEALLIERNSLDDQLQKIQQSQNSSVESIEDKSLVDKLQKQLVDLQRNYEETKKKNEMAEKEQEDLLVLLADNDARMKKYRTLLTDNNVELPESEGEDDDDDDDSDEDL